MVFSMEITSQGWPVLPEAASRRPDWSENQARRAADMTSAAGGQAMDGLSAGLGGQSVRPQRSSWRQNRPALPATMSTFCDWPS